MEVKVENSKHFVRVITVFLYVLFSLTLLIWLLVSIIIFTTPTEREINLSNLILLMVLVYFSFNPFYGIIKLRAWKNRVMTGKEKTVEHLWKTLAFVAIIFILIFLFFGDEINSFGGGLVGLFFAIIMSTGTGISSYRSLNWLHSKLFDKKTKDTRVNGL